MLKREVVRPGREREYQVLGRGGRSTPVRQRGRRGITGIEVGVGTRGEKREYDLYLQIVLKIFFLVSPYSFTFRESRDIGRDL